MTETTTAPAPTHVLPVGDDSKLPHIIIVGGGAGGLELATRLGEKLGRDRWWRKKQADISLIERGRTHIWKPLLHEIAAGSMDTSQHELEYQAQGYWHGFKFRYGEMTGIDRAEQHFDADQPEFPPELDLIAPAIGLVGVVAGGVVAGSPVWLSVARAVVGAAFLGVVSDGMLLGHWYLTQPGLRRDPLLEQVKLLGWIWPFEVALLLIPPGMVSALNGTIDDGYNGMLGWFWVACAVTTIGLVVVTRLALREKYYSAVMAATGLLYLAILTAFGTDLVARAILSNG